MTNLLSVAQGRGYGNALYAAIHRGDIPAVYKLLDNGADVNAQYEIYGNALQAASSRGLEIIVEILLYKGADVNAQGGEYGNALQAASFRGLKTMVQMLLDKGADINAQGGKYGNALQAASSRGLKTMVQMLLDKGADINAQGGEYGNALHAASSECYDQVVQMLLDKGADVNAQGGKYGNALQAASSRGLETVVQMLLDKGADVNAQGGEYGNALQAASSECYDQVVQMLLDKGADVNAQGGKYGNALQAASSRGLKTIVQMLLDKGADVSAQGGKYGNALQAASFRGLKTMIQMLLDKGADINAQGGEYGNALHAASYRGHDQVVQMLLDKGADVNAQGGEYGNALQAASYGGHDQVVQILLDKGADVNAQGGYYTNPLQAASYQSHETVVQLLLNRGANDDSYGSGSEIMSDHDEDFETEIGDLALPMSVSPSASLRNLISNPTKYFQQLRALAHLVYQHSTLHTYSKSYSSRMAALENKYSEPSPGYPESLKDSQSGFPKPLTDSEVTQICRDVGITHNACASDLFEILECRNVNAQTCSNLQRLQLDGFCSQNFSILTVDPSRENVVRLLAIDIQQILQLLEEIESVLRNVANSARRALPSTSLAKVFIEKTSREQDDLLLLDRHCMEFLNTLGLIPATPSARTDLSIPSALRLVVNTVDLAVVSYAGAHLDRFDKEYLGEDIAMIEVLDSFASLYKPQNHLIKLSRCQLQCLDSFHNSQPVWVFSSSDWKPRDNLFLSTKVEDFADIWGPLWKVIDSEVQDSCTRYAVGNGCIYKWKSQKTTPRLLKNETLCHWISNTTIQPGSQDSSNTQELVFPDSIDGTFDGNEILLIGAVAAGRERLASNANCDLDLVRERSRLDNYGRVQMLGTVAEHTYKESETLQLQVGHAGINASSSRQYKRQSWSLKQQLVQIWEGTPELRNPRLLKHFYGIEVSLCTKNAQRIQLCRILGLGCMRHYLSSFTWRTDGAKRAYLDALNDFRNSDALQRTWEEHQHYQEDFGRAILVCLKALAQTGINHKGELRALISLEATARPEVITLKREEHSWIGLLEDSVDVCCMAVIGDKCLEFKQKHGSTCGHPGRSVLRTALNINELIMPLGICKKKYKGPSGWTDRWSVRDMAIGSDLPLGTHGTLRPKFHLPDGTLLMDWRTNSLTTKVRGYIHEENLFHREYCVNIQKRHGDTRPVPVFVMSNL